MSQNRRRLLWVLLIVLGLHLIALGLFSPRLRQAVAPATPSATKAPVEDAIEIAPPPEPPTPPPRSKGLTLATSLGGGSPERAVEPLPPGFFEKLRGTAANRLKVSSDLASAPRSGAETVADIIPATLQLPALVALAPKPASVPKAVAAKPADRTPPPRAFIVPPLAALPPAPPSADSSPAAPRDSAAVVPPTTAAEAPVTPFRLPAPDRAAAEADIDAAIARASQSAEKSVHALNDRPRTPSADLRALLPQESILPPDAPVYAVPPPAAARTPATAVTPPAPAWTPEDARRQQAARQQFFALLTARLKAANQLALAEAVSAGSRVTVRMAFVIDRTGRVVDAAPAEEAPPLLVERALRVLHKAEPLPTIPETMAQETLELSFPVEVYR